MYKRYMYTHNEAKCQHSCQTHYDLLVCVCVYAHVSVCVSMCMSVCVCVCAHVCLCM